jgi:Na+-transporting NADH:ubiquinone oxidoreductase subunit NqrB
LSRARDPRYFQVAFLSSLLAAGLLWRGLCSTPAQIALTFAAGLLTQAAFLRALGLKEVGVLSALITCLSVSLLLHSDTLWVQPLAASAALAGKFMLRARGKHLFNPANLGVVFGLLMTGHAWCSPAQWGHDVMLAAWIVLLGATVVWRSERSDVSWSFLAFYLGLAFLRVAYLGQRPAVFWHQFENGSLLLFAFFMISDPKTIPDSRAGRVALAALAAVLAFGWQFVFYRQNGLFYALFLLTPLTALFDAWRPAPRHAWVRAELVPAATR